MISEADAKRVVDAIISAGSNVPWSEVSRLAKAHVQEDPTSSEEALMRALRRWFCTKYNLPLKAPIVDTYTPSDLIYEYLVVSYFVEHDPKTEKLANDDVEWAKKMAQQMAGGKIGEKTGAEQPPATENPIVNDPLGNKEDRQDLPAEPPPDLKTTFE